MDRDPESISITRDRKRWQNGKTEEGHKRTASGTQPSGSDESTTQSDSPSVKEEPSNTTTNSGLTASGDDGNDDDAAEPSRLRTAIRNFSSQWFLIPQGTGITSVVLYQLESRFDGLDEIAYTVWAFTGASLVLMLLVYATRAVLYPRHVRSLLASDAGELACLSSVSIALTSINQMAALTATTTITTGESTAAAAAATTTATAERWASLTVVVYWINTALAVSSMVLIPWAFAVIQPQHQPPPNTDKTPNNNSKWKSSSGIARLSPATQLPMVAAITLAAGGGVVAGNLPPSSPSSSSWSQPQLVPIVLVSYLSLALALPTALAYSTVYVVRLLDGSSPPAPAKVYQEMIFCGPWGQGSFALQALGIAVLRNAAGFADYGGGVGDILDETSVRVLGYGSVFLGFLCWGQGTFWWCFATLSSVRSHVVAWMVRWRNRPDPDGAAGEDGEGIGERTQKETYSLAAWSLVFPWGVYTNAAVQLGKLFASSAFKVWSTVLTVCLVILMIANLVLTAMGLWKGTLLGISSRFRRYAGDIGKGAEAFGQSSRHPSLKGSPDLVR